MSSPTYRGIAIALNAALDPAELQQFVDRLTDAAGDLELRADEELENGKRKILARRADVLGDLARAIEAEMEKAAEVRA